MNCCAQVFNIARTACNSKMAYPIRRAAKYSVFPSLLGAAFYYIYRPYVQSDEDLETMLRSRQAKPVSRRRRSSHRHYPGLGAKAVLNDYKGGDTKRPALAGRDRMDLFKERLNFKGKAPPSPAENEMQKEKQNMGKRARRRLRKEREAKEAKLQADMRRLQAELDELKKS